MPLLNVTALAPVNPVPVITTDVPTDPLVGLKLVIVGAGEEFTVNDPDEVAVPPGVVTVIGFVPGLVPLGTVVVIWVSLFTVRAS